MNAYAKGRIITLERLIHNHFTHKWTKLELSQMRKGFIHRMIGR